MERPTLRYLNDQDNNKHLWMEDACSVQFQLYYCSTLETGSKVEEYWFHILCTSTVWASSAEGPKRSEWKKTLTAGLL